MCIKVAKQEEHQDTAASTTTRAAAAETAVAVEVVKCVCVVHSTHAAVITICYRCWYDVRLTHLCLRTRQLEHSFWTQIKITTGKWQQVIRTFCCEWSKHVCRVSMCLHTYAHIRTQPPHFHIVAHKWGKKERRNGETQENWNKNSKRFGE